MSALGFHTTHDGAYTLRFDPSEASEVMVQRTFGGQVRHNLGWILAAVGGGLLPIIGCVMLVVGLVRRSAATRATSPTAGPVVPAGRSRATPAWHPDPTGEHRLRCWDGTRVDRAHQRVMPGIPTSR